MYAGEDSKSNKFLPELNKNYLSKEQVDGMIIQSQSTLFQSFLEKECSKV